MTNNQAKEAMKATNPVTWGRLGILAGLAVAVILMTGCATSRQHVPLPPQRTEEPAPGKTRVYVLRPDRFWGSDEIPVWDGNTLIGRTTGRSFLCWERDPGKVNLVGRCENTTNVSFVAEAGTTHYVLQEVKMGLWKCRTSLELIDEKSAQSWLRRCDPPDEMVLE